MAPQYSNGTDPNSKLLYSPFNKATVVKATPATTICQAVLTITFRSSSGSLAVFGSADFLLSDFLLYFEISEPTVQPMVPTVMTIMAVSFLSLSPSFAEAPKICSANNMTTPRKPRIRPNKVGMLEKFSFHFGLSRIMNQIAVAAERIDTMALEIYCSDQIMAAISIKSKRKPTNAASFTALLI